MDKKELLKALGKLGDLYKDEAVREIMVDGTNRVSYEHLDGTKRTLRDADLKFDSAEEVQGVIDGVLKAGQWEIGTASTVDVRLPDDGRFIAVLPPAAVNGPHVVIRKMHESTLSWQDLIEFGSVTQEQIDLIESAVANRANILISGGTNSGKTTVANLVVDKFPQEERVVVVERNRELAFEHPRAVFLEANPAGNASLSELIEAARNMVSQRIVFGELRGPEAAEALQLLSTGYNGLTTIHATSVEDALSRLEAMCLQAHLGLNLEAIRNLIGSAFQLVMHQARIRAKDGTYRRKVIQMSELQGIENGRYILQPLVRFDPEMEEFELTGVQPSWEN